ncbi:MAG: acyl-CoA synthetase [Parvibaculaceae bacterium]
MYIGTWAQQNPEKVAIAITGSDNQQTYKQLNDRSNQLSRLWWERGLRRGDHVAIFLDNDIRYMEIVWAALRSGLYVTPINWHLTAAEAAYILDDCEAKSIVTSSRIQQSVGLFGFPSKCEIWLSIDGGAGSYEDYDSAIGTYPAAPLPEQPAGAYMLYSSGTTGRPKGIKRPLPEQSIDQYGATFALSHKNLWGMDENSVYLSTAPLYHSAPIAFATATLVLGGSIILMQKFDALESLKNIDKYSVTHTQWVPTMFSRMLKLDLDRSQFDLSSHKVAVHAAAPCPRKVKEQMLDWWGDIIYEYYGGSEGNGLTHVTPQEWRKKPGTVGRAVMGKLHVCDEDGKELPCGEPGLIYFEMPKLPFKYHNDTEKTKKAQHPQHANWSALGDVGYVDEDGFLFLTDRATFMIISGGVNIYPQEIEDALVMHPKVADVAVIGVPNEEMGEEVKAIVKLAPGISPSPELEEELLKYARENIARFKCPKSVDFTDELPRLPTGKLYKRLLKDKYWGKTASRIV